MNRLNELIRFFGITDTGFACFQKFFEDKVLLADHDGSICDTNQVKDSLLGQFCREMFGYYDTHGNFVEDACVNNIHRNAHGMPMNTIFVEIAKKIYGKDISPSEGYEVTLQLNDFIRPTYINMGIYKGAAEYHEMLHLLGVPQYILTGMEDDMIISSLTQHEIIKYFEMPILGSKNKKRDWVDWIVKKYPNKRIFATGDALSEYKATTAVKGTVFIGLDFENRDKKLFPEDVEVCTSYDSLILSIMIRGCSPATC